jgi:hypothetical protein
VPQRHKPTKKSSQIRQGPVPLHCPEGQGTRAAVATRCSPYPALSVPSSRRFDRLGHPPAAASSAYALQPPPPRRTPAPHKTSRASPPVPQPLSRSRARASSPRHDPSEPDTPGREPHPAHQAPMDSAASAALKPSALDLLAALLTGRDPEGGAHWASALAENRHLFLLLTTSLAVLVGCGVALLVRRSSAPRAAAAAAQAAPRPLAAKPKDEPDPDDGRQRVTVFFGTQTGTAEGFAKVPTQTLLLCLLCLRSLLQTTARARRSARLLAPLAKIGFDGTFGRGCRRSPKRPR